MTARALSYLDRRGLFARPGKIALVTPEILGLRRTGGIGTAMTALAERLAGAGHEVHVYFSPYGYFLLLRQSGSDTGRRAASAFASSATSTRRDELRRCRKCPSFFAKPSPKTTGT